MNEHIGKYRWTICALLFAATTINYLDRAVIGLVKTGYLDPEFNWSKSDYANVTVAFQANEISKSIKANDQVTIFRIVQELINNALKHSNCTEIIVDCSQNDDLFLITVEDNGKGFNSDDLAAYNGLGLKNIKNRIELLKGKLDVQSIPNKGTVFNIELLLQTNDD